MNQPLRVGIVGGNAERGWAYDAHVPALKRLTGDYVIEAVSARRQDLAEAARAAFGANRAFGDSLALVRDPDVDVVAVCVKVPEHLPIVLAALEAGKHVHCEWPLGVDVAEAEAMAAAVQPQSHVMIGLQALSAPAVRQAVDLVAAGALGRLQVMRVFSPTAGWATQAPPHYAYLQDRRNGATLATIAGGHTLAALEAIAGAYVEVDARNSILNDRVRISGTDEVVQRTCADHMLVLGRHASGCISTLEVTGGAANRPFTLELMGEKGSLTITGGHAGGFQTGALTLETTVAAPPQDPYGAPDLRGPPLNLFESYVRLRDDIRSGTRTVPDFAAAVRNTRLLEAIDRASDEGARQRL
jgi:predicted dehydrogenase